MLCNTGTHSHWHLDVQQGCCPNTHDQQHGVTGANSQCCIVCHMKPCMMVAHSLSSFYICSEHMHNFLCRVFYFIFEIQEHMISLASWIASSRVVLSSLMLCGVNIWTLEGEIGLCCASTTWITGQVREHHKKRYYCISCNYTAGKTSHLGCTMGN